jgi:hypothetical protein
MIDPEELYRRTTPGLPRAARTSARRDARRHHPDHHLLRPLPALHRPRRGLPDLGRMGELSTPMGEEEIQRFVDAADAEQLPRWQGE